VKTIRLSILLGAAMSALASAGAAIARQANDVLVGYQTRAGLILQVQPTNTYDRYDAGTNVREDLIDKITMTNPAQTPVTSMAGRDTADQTFHEWQRDNLRAPNKDNAAIDGDDATATNKTPPARVGNHCQIFQDTLSISRRADRVKKAGMAKATAYYKAKAYKELQRDYEAAILSNNPAVVGTSAAAAKMAGAGAMIYTNASHGAGGSTPAHTSGAATVAPTAGTARAFTETLLKAVMQSTFTNAGTTPPAVYMSPSHKALFSAFTGIAVNRYQVGKKEQGRIIGGADVYVSDFGDLQVVPHYIMAGASTVFGLDPDYIDAVYLDGFQSEKLGKTGDSNREQVLVDCTLRLTSEMAHFKVADLTP